MQGCLDMLEHWTQTRRHDPPQQALSLDSAAVATATTAAAGGGDGIGSDADRGSIGGGVVDHNVFSDRSFSRTDGVESDL